MTASEWADCLYAEIERIQGGVIRPYEVEAAVRRFVEGAVLQEREACARICERTAGKFLADGLKSGASLTADLAREIKERTD